MTTGSGPTAVSSSSGTSRTQIAGQRSSSRSSPSPGTPTTVAIPPRIPSMMTGHRQSEDDHAPAARIVAAFVHPNDEKIGVEHVSIRNDSDEPLSVGGWRLLNRDGDATILDGVVPPRAVRRFDLRR